VLRRVVRVELEVFVSVCGFPLDASFCMSKKNIPFTDADKLSELQHVVDALKINGYTDQFIRSCQSTIVPTNQSQTKRGFVTLPYIQGTSERMARTLNQFSINVAHKLVMTVCSILKKP